MNFNSNRRKFIKVGGQAAATALFLPAIACNQTKETTSAVAEEVVKAVTNPSIDKFGLQLYTLRDIIGDDPKGTLKSLADFGYSQIEGYEGPQGMFWDMDHMDFKSYIGDLGLNMISSHCNINENFEEKAKQAAAVGMKYLICPYIGPGKSAAEWKTIAAQFNACGKICTDNGIRFAYHNHDYSFIEHDGIIAQDYLMETCDPEHVDFELDLYWVVVAGVDPVEYMKKHPGRFKLSHVKDRMKDSTDQQASCTIGTGIIDYPTILKEAKALGMEYFIVEQERYDGTTPIKCAEDNANYMKNLVFA